jgi:hypothetical protein
MFSVIFLDFCIYVSFVCNGYMHPFGLTALKLKKRRGDQEWQVMIDHTCLGSTHFIQVPYMGGISGQWQEQRDQMRNEMRQL